MASAARTDSRAALCAVLVLLAACAAVPRARAAAADSLSVRGSEGLLVRRSGHRVIETTAGEAKAGLALPDVFILTGSDSLSAASGALERGADYTIDYRSRVLSLSALLPDSLALTVSYSFLPLGLAGSYTAARVETAAVLAHGFPEPAPPAPPAPAR